MGYVAVDERNESQADYESAMSFCSEKEQMT